jgi:Zn-dependent M28 family amino/carboxypeptidase
LPWGRTLDVINYGPTGTSLDSILAAVAETSGRAISPDPTPEERYFERSDQYPFAMAGVPAIFPAPGTRYVGRPDGYGSAKLEEYSKHDYHQASDEVRADWDLSGIAQEVRLLAQVGYEVAQWSGRPVWLPSTVCVACRAARDSTLAREARK